jgi:hypothetical protein
MRSKHLGKFLGAAMAAVIVVAMLAPAAQAVKPKPPYEQFAGCPTKTEVPATSTCVHSVVKSGFFHLGSKEVPISTPIPLSGGTDTNLQNFRANAEGGLKVVNQKVPGGVIGLTGLTWLLEFLGSEALTLYAATEIAGQPVLNGLNNITLPIKVHLINGVLGSKCYIGSFTEPIVLHLSTEVTGGVEPIFEEDETTQIVHLTNGTYIDRTFSAPGANGCVLTLFGFIPISINGLVNSQSGLPAASGKNETLQVIDTELANVKKVYPPTGG